MPVGVSFFLSCPPAITSAVSVEVDIVNPEIFNGLPLVAMVVACVSVPPSTTDLPFKVSPLEAVVLSLTPVTIKGFGSHFLDTLL